MPRRYAFDGQVCEADGTVISTHGSHWEACAALLALAEIEEPVQAADPELACMLENDSLGG